MESSASYQELVPMGRKSTEPLQQPQQPQQPQPPKPFRRPVSYSDSFFFIPSSLDPLDLSGSSLDLIASADSPTTSTTPAIATTSLQSQPQSPAWVLIPFSFLFHIALISMFESAFFYLFISKSEDKGITTTVQHLVNQVTDTCPWPTNQTIFLSDLLGLFINATAIQSASTAAGLQRSAYNAHVFLQAWMYTVGIGGLTLVSYSVAAYKKWLTWPKLRGILLENLGLVGMLGIYEFLFFKTVIYQYDSVSVPEIEGSILAALRQQCGLFAGTQ